jgi:chitinase
VTALAVAKNGNSSTSAPVTISVVQDVAPAVSITSPSDGDTFADKATVSLAATATSEYSTISSVEYYNGSTSLKKVTTAPYSYSWTKVAAGTYTLTAVATDAQGLQTTSTAVTITVN